jgi:hypothetical protein
MEFFDFKANSKTLKVKLAITPVTHHEYSPADILMANTIIKKLALKLA